MSVSGVSVIADHLMHGWGLPICAWSSLASQERLSNRPHCTTTQHVSPSASPSGLGTKKIAEDFTLRDFARDRAVRNWRVLEDHRPATSPPKTTKRHLPPSPDNSGHVLTLRLLAALSATLSLVAAPALAVPSLLASMASSAPPNSGRPSATTSRRHPSNLSKSPRSMLWTNMLVVTRAPSQHMRATTLSTAKPRRPNTPAIAQAAPWWPRTSSGRPHLQLRCDKGSGRRRREQQNTETLWLNPEQPVCGATGERGSRQRASL